MSSSPFEETGKGISTASNGGVSVMRASCSIVMTAVGIGILALPRATAESGFVGGCITLCVAGLASFIAGLLLWKALFLNPTGVGTTAMPTFEEMGSVAFGRWGSVYFGLILHVVLTAICAVLLVLLASTTVALTKTWNIRLWIMVWALVCLPLSWIRKMKSVGIVASIGVLSVCVLVAVVIIACIQQLIESGPAKDYSVMSNDPLDLLSNFATFIFSFGFSATTPTITFSMKEPKRYPVSLAIAAIFCVLVYAVVMLLGYGAYGNSLLQTDTIVQAISPPNERLSPSGWVINLVVLVVVASHFLVLFTPTALAVDDLLSRARCIKGRSRIWSLAARSGVVILQALIGIAIPSVDKLVNLIGALCVIQLCFIIPIACYVKLKRMAGIPIGKLEVLWYILLLLLALLAMGIGIYGAIVALL
ncbi:hypothetical protein FOL47_006766 [Perkinsus chesapeaki]|uniref:Amino acid transporter transmembrane domain-containing protein n=1 Tax=Perkinsus chesapeaki TaxID=330153 RepID=A0A7J6LPM8_PERCH|nr:hypothetical protein FOL47_006766 [Perkinsus chesapeaki]